MTLDTIKARKYDWTAAAGLIVAAWPTIQDHITGAGDLSSFWSGVMQIVGLAMAALGKSLVVRAPAPVRSADFEDTP